MTAVWSVIIALGVVVFFLGLLVVALLRSHAEILRRLDSLGVRLDDEEQGTHDHIQLSEKPVDGEAADIAGLDPGGEPIVVSPSSGADPVLLAFLSTSCSSCTVFWEAFTAPTVRLGGVDHRTVVVTLGADEESPTRAEGLRRGSVDVVMSSEAWRDYEVPGAPYFVMVDPRTRAILGEGTSSTLDSLETFLGDAAGDLEWDRRRGAPDRTDSDRERMIDAELKRAGLEPGDPRLYHTGDSSDDD